MAIKFEKIKPGMTLYDRRSQRMGNTTLRSIDEWEVKVISVHRDGRFAIVSWNSNRPEQWGERRLTRLHDWSMHDKEVATYKTGMTGAVHGVRKLTKAEREARAAKKREEEHKAYTAAHGKP